MTQRSVLQVSCSARPLGPDDGDEDDTVSTAPSASGTGTPPTPGLGQQCHSGRHAGLGLQQRRAIRFPGRRLKLDTDVIVQEGAGRDPFLAASARGSAAWERYSLLQALGQGSTGVVYAAKRKEDGQEVALKVMRMHDEENLNNARKEFELLRGIVHRHIICAHDFFTYSMGAVLVLDAFRGMSLESAVRSSEEGRLVEGVARPLFAALFDAISYLHRNCILHRDVKAENVLVSSDLGDLKLIDFNVARQTTKDEILTMAGTADYMPPEVLLGEALTEAADVWSAGLCLHLALAGALPLERNNFQSHRDFGLALRRGGCSREAPHWSRLGLSAPCLATLGQCLDVDHRRRAAAATVLSGAWLSPSFGRYSTEEEP